MNSTTQTRSRWTTSDEARLKELVERKHRIMTENREPVVELVVASGLAESTSMVAPIVAWLIDNADEVRDALEPFDSGSRAAS